MLNTLIGLLIYPGLALTLALGLALRQLLGETPLRSWPSVGAIFGKADGITALASVVLAALGLAWAPLPFNPMANRPGWPAFVPGLIAVEVSFLLPAFTGLLAPSVLAQRAVSRDMQIGLAGRVIVWAVIGALASQPVGALLGLVGRVFMLVGGLLAIPAAAGMGPFGPERTLSRAGAETGLDEPLASLLRLARSIRAGALLALLIAVALAPIAIRPEFMALIGLALVLVIGVAVRALSRWPLFTLPTAVRWCWTRALPVALAGLGLLALVGG